MIFGPLCEICNASMYVSTCKLMSCSNSCVDLFSIFAVVSVFCTVCSIDFAFSIMWSSSSSGGQDMSVFVAGGFGKPKRHDLFLRQYSECVCFCKLFMSLI